MTLLLPADGRVWPTALAIARWDVLSASTLFKTWTAANPGETRLVTAYWQGDVDRPTVKTAFGRHLVDHAVDLRALAGLQP